jgi:phosphoglycerate kinase
MDKRDGFVLYVPQQISPWWLSQFLQKDAGFMNLYNTLDSIDVSGKTVLLRVDLNVPMFAGKVTDATRIERVLPTIEYLREKNARVVLLSHFGRPKGKYEPTMSLAPLVDALAGYISGGEVRFGVDCVGKAARENIEATPFGSVILMENLRFHWQEEAGDEAFAKEMASLGDVYVNDAFSCSHRAHASISGLPNYLPTVVGLSMQQEIEMLTELFTAPERPLVAIVGGSKVSTKLALLENLVEKVDYLIIGGAMANTFLHAQGISVGDSLCEYEMKDIALSIFKRAEACNCQILLPQDMVVATALSKQVPCRIVSVDAIPAGSMALDVGPKTLNAWAQAIESSKTLVWNGPVGAFETSPFDISTSQLARIVAAATDSGQIKSVAGGGDTVSALNHAGLRDAFTYLSTAGGAFLEWLEGKTLPGVVALQVKKAA